MTKIHTVFQKGDLTGIVNSTVCILHCVGAPLLTIGIGWHHHAGLNYVFVILAFFSVWTSTEETDNTAILTILWVSFWVFLFSLFFNEEYLWLRYFNYVSSITLIIGHILNIKYCRKCNDQKRQNKE